MPVPWEALIPFGKLASLSLLSSADLLSSLGLVTALFGAAGTLLNVSKRTQNQGKVSQSSISRYVSVLICFPHVPQFSLRDTILTLGRR